MDLRYVFYLCADHLCAWGESPKPRRRWYADESMYCDVYGCCMAAMSAFTGKAELPPLHGARAPKGIEPDVKPNDTSLSGSGSDDWYHDAPGAATG